MKKIFYYFLLLAVSVVISKQSYSQAQTCACTSGCTETQYGIDSWIGHVYDNSNTTAKDFATYRGYVTESTVNFDRNWGDGSTLKPTCSTGSAGSAGNYFNVRYLMKKNYPAGTYTITYGQDDGGRVFIGTTPITTVAGFAAITWPTQRWSSTGNTTYTFDWAGGDMYIVFEYNEVTGGARANITLFCYNGPVQNYGAGNWNGYAYTLSSMAPDQYRGLISAGYTSQIASDYNISWASGVSPTVSATPSGATTCAAPVSDFYSRHLMNQTYTRGFYNLVWDMDDGLRISKSGPTPWLIANTISPAWSWDIVDNLGNSPVAGSATALLDGSTNFVIDHKDNGSGGRVKFSTCKMNGDYTVPNYPLWNAYAFNSSNIDFKTYSSWYQTSSSGTTLIDNNFVNAIPSNSIGGISNYTVGGCSGPSLSAGNFSVSYLTSRTYGSNGVWVFSSTLNDDGRQMLIDGTTVAGMGLLSDGAAAFTSSPTLINSGAHNLIYNFRAGGTPNRANIVECQMSGGDLTAYGAGPGANSWNVYVYNAGNYNFLTADYRGIFTTGSSSATAASFGSLTDVNVANNRTGACGTAHSSNSAINLYEHCSLTHSIREFMQ